MLKEKIQSVQAALGEVLGNTKSEDDAELLRCCRRNLASIAEQAEALENNLLLRPVGQHLLSCNLKGGIA